MGLKIENFTDDAQASQPLIEAICTMMESSDDDFFNNPMLCPIGTRNIDRVRTTGSFWATAVLPS